MTFEQEMRLQKLRSLLNELDEAIRYEVYHRRPRKRLPGEVWADIETLFVNNNCGVEQSGSSPAS